jgi:hypothetical protein
VRLDLTGTPSSFRVQWLNPENGMVITKEESIKGGKIVEVKKPQPGNLILWLRKK